MNKYKKENKNANKKGICSVKKNCNIDTYFFFVFSKKKMFHIITYNAFL